MLLENKIDYECPDCKIALVDFSAESADYSGLCKNCRRIFNKEFLRQMQPSQNKFQIIRYTVTIGDLVMNQEMTPVDKSKNTRLNTPSEASEQARYNQGYKDGLLRAIEEIELSSAHALFSINKYGHELKTRLIEIMTQFMGEIK